MATTYKVLGQVAPAATTATTLYTAANPTVCSTLVIANRGVSTQVRVAVRPAGATLADQHYVMYDVPVNQYDSLFLTIGITLAATDVLTVYAGTSTVSFSVFGSEVTA